MARSQFPSLKPTFDMELANLNCVVGDDCRSSSCLPGWQYWPVDLTTLRAASQPPAFRVTGSGGSKRVRFGDGGSESSAEGGRGAAELRFGGLGAVALEAARCELSSSRRFFNCIEDPPELSDDDYDCYDEDEEEEEMEDVEGRFSEDGVEAGDGGVEELRRKGSGRDPLEVFDVVVVQHILGFLDPQSLGTCLAVSRGWSKCAQADFLWEAACKREWEGKLHVLPKALDPATTPRLRAFAMAAAEGQRTNIEPRDLCDWVWELDFCDSDCGKESGDNSRVSTGRRRSDGLPSVRRIFHRDSHFVPPGYSSSDFTHSLWTLAKSSNGASIVHLAGWPPLTVSRTPNWGWKLENANFVYESTNVASRCC